ncbi:hypothetical protein Tcan_05774 [Toxocara canis]|uniref:Pepsin inhibitor-3-like repeated domain-containing protein n=1 Tax=Toxocara canis TaxID=6265 RepID=A0A0B2V9S4_TOXCA|nr:hypothetical protein Tcan_05774 [Toxocara canis]
MGQRNVTLTSHFDGVFASIYINRAELELVKIFLVASFVCASLALPLEPVDSEDFNSAEIDDFELFGCRVVNGTKLFFDDIFIRELNEDERKENKKYEKDMKAFDEAGVKAVHNGETEFKLDVEFPEVPKFCDDLEKVDLGDCYALDGNLYKGNIKMRSLSEKEKKEVKDYQERLEKYFDDACKKTDGDFDPEKVMAETPKGPKLCN